MTSTVSLSLASVLWFWLSFCRPKHRHRASQAFLSQRKYEIQNTGPKARFVSIEQWDNLHVVFACCKVANPKINFHYLLTPTLKEY